jgi:hypothetical protein
MLFSDDNEFIYDDAKNLINSDVSINVEQLDILFSLKEW